MANETTRRALMFKLKQMILNGREQGDFIKKDKLLGYLMGEKALARRTALEYINGLVLSGFIKINEETGNVIPSDEYKSLNSVFGNEADKILKEAKPK